MVHGMRSGKKMDTVLYNLSEGTVRAYIREGNLVTARFIH